MLIGFSGCHRQSAKVSKTVNCPVHQFELSTRSRPDCGQLALNSKKMAAVSKFRGWPSIRGVTKSLDTGLKTFAGLLVTGTRMPRYLPVTFAVAVLVASATDAISEHVYSVGELALGGRYNSDVYRKYDCNPSEQFEGFTWCVLKKDKRERRGSFKASYSILHSRDGTAVYINRFQEPAYWDDNELKDDIAHYSRKVGEQPRIFRMPSRPGLPDAMIAVWGKVELEPLDNDSRQILAADKSVKRGILVDYLGNYTRSARENLPLYRITGGAGFVWICQ
jgi:hypothetical protein